MKHFFEWYLGVPPGVPGQETRWRWSYEPPWPGSWPTAAVAVVGGCLLAAIVWVYLRDTSRLPIRTRLGLIGVRLLATGCVLLCLTNAAILIQRTGRPVVAILVDTSASMSLEDRYADPEHELRITRLAGRRRPSRLNLVKSLLADGDGLLIQRISKRFQVRLYAFDAQARTLGSPDDTAERLARRIEQLTAVGNETRPGPAVRQVLEEFRGEPPAAIVLLTDGITSTSAADGLAAVTTAARRQLVPLVTVATGSRLPARDLHLLEPQLDDIALVDNPIVVRVDLQSYGLVGQRATVRLQLGDDSQPVAEQSVTLEDDGHRQSVELSWVPRTEGDHVLTIEAVPLDTETDRNNNKHVRLVRVRQQQIRVLLADGTPRWEFRYVKHLLARDPGIDLTSVLQDADPELVRDNQSTREYFPVDRDELFEYDVVIIGDIDPGLLSTGIQENLRDFVRTARGGLILVAGTTHNPTAYRNTPLEDLVPVDLATLRVPDPAETLGPWQGRLTTAGLESTSLFGSRADTDDITVQVNGLPPFHWLLEIPRTKPGAVVLLECSGPTSEDQTRPVVLLQRYGAGSVLFHATDELWRWRLRAGRSLYERYWLQAVRLLGRARLLGQTRTAELVTDRTEYTPGDPTTLRLRFFSTTDVPAADRPPVVRVERRSGSARDITLEPVQGNVGLFTATVTNSDPGSYHAWVRSPGFQQAPPAADYRVVAADREFRQRAVDIGSLQQAARETHGLALAVEDAGRIDQLLPAGDPVPLAVDSPIRLWNRWELLLAFATALTLEWLWRRQSRLV
ncbi:MAG TPA: hypothetical protein DCE47_06180 [Planctomycetaceae bacterium]|nr:hypothetical protein [Planctomycetaceae bacterium]HCD01453.1 hypothetical protein [Planctomycetaceae bacterium]